MECDPKPATKVLKLEDMALTWLNQAKSEIVIREGTIWYQMYQEGATAHETMTMDDTGSVAKWRDHFISYRCVSSACQLRLGLIGSQLEKQHGSEDMWNMASV